MGRDGVAGLLLLAISGVLAVQSRHIPRSPFLPLGADFFPRILLILLAAGGLLLLVQDLLRHRKRPAPESLARFRDVPPSVPTTFAAFAAYIFLMPTLGFFLATLAFVAVAQVLLGPYRPRDLPRIALLAIGTATATYLIFERYLHVLLPRGVLF
ncbi:MAG: tripartite tricarboxylate transporter TctB family protein [candidate division NC10 bacterium]|nr:tripartite tricarboxylate transporter TctB family protein [candidate division NC10 bacterium]MBI4391508.1 tripartite tricarboxylate transporter TctB family protein [candidate division NC10 bacterium]